MPNRRLLLTVLLAAGCGAGRGPTPLDPGLAGRNLRRGGVYREVRVAAQWLDLVDAAGRTWRVAAPPTRGGAEVRQDLLAATRRAPAPAPRIVTDPAAGTGGG